MKYLKFEIRNFKGIKHVELDLSKSTGSRVYALIGLNESGKTTVLEAIDRLQYREAVDAVGAPGYQRQDIHELIPIAERANFTGTISISVIIGLDEADKKAITKQLWDDHQIEVTSPLPSSFPITQTHEFDSSRFVRTGPMLWTISPLGRKPDARRATPLEGDDWQKLTKVMIPKLPRVMYFPNNLFDFPDKVYLNDAPTAENPKHEFFRAVLQDVLDAMDDKINLTQHVLLRAQSTQEFDKKILDSILLKMGAHITKTVFSAWDKIFKQPVGSKEIVVTIGKETRKRRVARAKTASPGASPSPTVVSKDIYFIRLRLKDGTTYYEISERSLGFRWFFTYLLLMQYRGFRKKGSNNITFLLDEPASNLHPSAQTQLLDSFQRLPDGCQIIYTTHSQHLIKPEWLDSAFVVKNQGLDYSNELEQYSSRQTDVTVRRYREFAAQHPNQTTYFQPVLDVLDYVPTRLDLVSDAVMVEGKLDFFALRYMQHLLKLSELCFIPGTGAGSLDTAIRLYVGWGRNFLVLLDGDLEGEAQKTRYVNLFGPLVTDRLFTLANFNPLWAKRGIERMFTPDDALKIQKNVFPDTDQFNKGLFGKSIQELMITARPVSLSKGTLDGFTTLFTALISSLSRNQNET
jgi:ABC-type Mn2+/Zn2+ transport system ATPase subunit